VVCDPAGNIALEIGQSIGTNTNQVAEYEGVLRALDELKRRGARRARVFTDSEFVVKQVNGQYKARDARMKVLLGRVQSLSSGFEAVDLVHIRRSSHPHNVRADGLVNATLDALRDKA
jgi:ribonuclease HI